MIKTEQKAITDKKAGGIGSVSHNNPADESRTGPPTARTRALPPTPPLRPATRRPSTRRPTPARSGYKTGRVYVFLRHTFHFSMQPHRTLHRTERVQKRAQSKLRILRARVAHTQFTVRSHKHMNKQCVQSSNTALSLSLVQQHLLEFQETELSSWYGYRYGLDAPLSEYREQVFPSAISLHSAYMLGAGSKVRRDFVTLGTFQETDVTPDLCIQSLYLLGSCLVMKSGWL